MISDVLAEAKEKMHKSVEAAKDDFSNVRTGRANAVVILGAHAASDLDQVVVCSTKLTQALNLAQGVREEALARKSRVNAHDLDQVHPPE